MTPIRVAIIGAGGIGGTHLRAYGAWESLCQVVGIADVQLLAAQEKAAEAGCLAFADYVQMLDEVQPDAVSICTPPNLHLPVAQAAAARHPRAV
ncbi:MAG: Gfo/Idh/MocA family oxidoreductase [Caldilineaceae bacterium]